MDFAQRFLLWRHAFTLKVLKGVWVPYGEFIEVDEGCIGVILKHSKNDENRKTAIKVTKTESKIILNYANLIKNLFINGRTQQKRK